MIMNKGSSFPDLYNAGVISPPRPTMVFSNSIPTYPVYYRASFLHDTYDFLILFSSP